eukprot:1185177-Prorocentrum_minimum.AAC.6
MASGVGHQQLLDRTSASLTRGEPRRTRCGRPAARGALTRFGHGTDGRKGKLQGRSRAFQERSRSAGVSHLRVRASASVAEGAISDDWRKARPIKQGTPRERYPAQEHCSRCGLCDTYYIAHVKEACAFLGEGNSRIETMEPMVHGRARDYNNIDELHFGVYDEMFYATNKRPSAGVQPAQCCLHPPLALIEARVIIHFR